MLPAVKAINEGRSDCADSYPRPAIKGFGGKVKILSSSRFLGGISNPFYQQTLKQADVQLLLFTTFSFRIVALDLEVESWEEGQYWSLEVLATLAPIAYSSS